ncbi:MAG: chorismate mutase [Pseudomonadota bacterium]|nr:chorismate mutase [Pseudomonadota bacterium]
MAKDKIDLSKVREEIDEVDSKILELLMRRAEIVDDVRAAKLVTNTVAYRPGREAQVLRRLALLRKGNFPLAALIRIWREIMAASVAMQQDFTCAFCDSEAGGAEALVKDNFGVMTQMSRYASPDEVINAVKNGECSVGLLPKPIKNEQRPWWQHFYFELEHELRICGSAFSGNNFLSPEALIIGKVPPEETGADSTYFVIEHDRSFDDVEAGKIFVEPLMDCVSVAGPTIGRHSAYFSLLKIKGFYLEASEFFEPQLEEFIGLTGCKCIGNAPLGILEK